jgi:osmotically inducible protein OsmC
MVAGEPVSAGWAHLAVVIHRLRIRLSVGINSLIVAEINRKIGIESSRPLRQHARQISIRGKHSAPRHPRRLLMHQLHNAALTSPWRRTRQKQPNFKFPQGGTMASKASAVWTGSLKEGKGTISTATGVLSNANYSFATRFEGADSGTTPEELIAAAHASCFSMALGAQLGGAGLTPEKIETQAAVTLAKVGDGFAITKIALTTTAHVPGASQEVFDKAAQGAKSGCPISKLFANNTEIVLNAKLV